MNYCHYLPSRLESQQKTKICHKKKTNLHFLFFIVDVMHCNAQNFQKFPYVKTMVIICSCSNASVSLLKFDFLEFFKFTFIVAGFRMPAFSNCYNLLPYLSIWCLKRSYDIYWQFNSILLCASISFRTSKKSILFLLSIKLYIWGDLKMPPRVVPFHFIQ